MKNESLGKFFNPKTIAVIGASDRPHSVGGAIFSGIKNSAFAGKVFPVNNKNTTVQGQKAFPSVGDIGEKVDLAVIATPAPAVLPILDDCVRAGVGGAAIVSSGFKESGKQGKKDFAAIQKLAQTSGMRILGPNCLGFANSRAKLNASFAPQSPLPGSIAFVSQSGALCGTFLDWSLRDNIGFSHFVSIGSAADIDFAEMIEYLSRDENVGSILLYMESLNDGPRFIAAAREFCQTKPIVCLKAGANLAGAAAAVSHTGAIAGDDKVFSAVFERAGIIRAATISEFYNYARTLNHCKKPQGRRLAIITNAGGSGVISADFLAQNGGELAKLAPRTIKMLAEALPPAASLANPIDVLGDGAPEHYRAAVSACLEDKNVDGIMAIISPQAVTQSKKIAEEIAGISGIAAKPVFISFMGAARVAEGVEVFRRAGIPTYRTPEKAIACFLGLAKWQKDLTRAKKAFSRIRFDFDSAKNTAAEIFAAAAAKKQSIIDGEPARKILQAYGLPVNPAQTAKNAGQAAAVAGKIGFPVALKLQSGQAHKTELGGVRLNLGTAAEVKKAFAEIEKNAKKHLQTKNFREITVEKMIDKKYELIVGAKIDPLFGPVIVFGMGGTAVEIFDDTAIGLPPLDIAGAKELMAKTKIFKLLKGYRNLKGVNIEELAGAMAHFSRLPLDFPQIKEIDVNPLAADQTGIVALDAKIILEK